MSFFANLVHRPRIATADHVDGADGADDAYMRDAHEVTVQSSLAHQLEESLGFSRPERQRRTKRSSNSARSTRIATSWYSEPNPVLAKIEQAHPFFKSTPPAVQFEILSYLPPNEISSLRKLCQELYDIIALCEPKLAARAVISHKTRLQNIIDSINGTQSPTDADSLLSCLRVWTSIRGSYSHPTASMLLFQKWFSHLKGGTPKSQPNEPLAEFERWALLATHATCLQDKVNQARKDGWPGGNPWRDFESSVSPIGEPLWNAAELWKLYDRIISAQDAAEQDIKGPFHQGKGQKKILPRGVIHHRLTAIRPYAGSGRLSYGQLRIDPPTLVPERFSYVYLSELPKLPGQDTFCYYVKHEGYEEWVLRLMKARVQSGITKKMNLLMQAAVLEFVEIW